MLPKDIFAPSLWRINYTPGGTARFIFGTLTCDIFTVTYKNCTVRIDITVSATDPARILTLRVIQFQIYFAFFNTFSVAQQPSSNEDRANSVKNISVLRNRTNALGILLFFFRSQDNSFIQSVVFYGHSRKDGTDILKHSVRPSDDQEIFEFPNITIAFLLLLS